MATRLNIFTGSKQQLNKSDRVASTDEIKESLVSRSSVTRSVLDYLKG